MLDLPWNCLSKVSRSPGPDDVHQAVKRGGALGGRSRQRNGHLRIRHAGAGQHGADREITVHGVQMPFVADPAFLMPLAVAFASHVTTDGQVRQIFGQCARWLEFQAFGRRGRTDFAPLGPAPLARCRRGGRGRFGGRPFGCLDVGGTRLT